MLGLGLGLELGFGLGDQGYGSGYEFESDVTLFEAHQARIKRATALVARAAALED